MNKSRFLSLTIVKKNKISSKSKLSHQTAAITITIAKVESFQRILPNGFAALASLPFIVFVILAARCIILLPPHPPKIMSDEDIPIFHLA